MLYRFNTRRFVKCFVYKTMHSKLNIYIKGDFISLVQTSMRSSLLKDESEYDSNVRSEIQSKSDGGRFMTSTITRIMTTRLQRYPLEKKVKQLLLNKSHQRTDMGQFWKLIHGSLS